ncbi:hypothetical protein B0F90DRAFT_1714787 [Multifurca ochricompacta]|uniref:Berberine/berberine-like domain-containing protein n=1 Tax=Multifurca ochricompacta TaxID=376703 RepID=A0AAD4QPE7_9AGAM|nr:hypothetical protein B0F90DRAFT_1714787 [Multifurca ochricompacta]
MFPPMPGDPALHHYGNILILELTLPLVETAPPELWLACGAALGVPVAFYKSKGEERVQPNIHRFRFTHRSLRYLISMEKAPKMTTTNTLPTLDQAHLEELSTNIRGEVYRRGDNRFHEHTRLFNGNVLNTSRAVALPLDAQDVSRIIIFCIKHGLSPSVKAGGYGTAGWAINGDIIIDLSRIQDIDIEPPQAEGGGLPGKARMGKPVLDPSGPLSRKRALEGNDAEQAAESSIPPSAWLYTTASAAVASFLHGPSLPPDDSGEEPRRPAVNRRRLGIDGSALAISTLPLAPEPLTSRSDSLPSGVSGLGSAVSSMPSALLSSGQGRSTLATLPALSRSPRSNLAISSIPAPFTSIEPFETAPVRPDPFAYIDNATRPSWGSDAALLAHSLFTGDIPPHLSRPVPPHTHAYVSFGAGARQKDVDLFTASHPLEGGIVPYHVPFSAHPVGASVMMLGGFGFLSRLHGLMLADGRIVIVNEKEHPDLWWGLRGSGPALCIATRYKARAYPVPIVFAGNLIYRFHRATAPSLLRHFRDCVKGAPRELYANVLLTAGPADKDSLVVIQMCYIGPKEQGLEYLQALSSWTGERCLLNEVHEKTFLSQQDSVAQVLRGKRGNQWFIRSALISSLPDNVINQTVLEFADTPVGCTWLFELAGGAIVDHEETCVAKAKREAAFTIAALHQWEMGVDDPRCVSSAEDVRLFSLIPSSSFPLLTMTRHFYLTPPPSFPLPFLGRHEPPARVAASFGENWGRLVTLKKKYDPTGLFRNTFWPLDKDGAEIDPSEHEPPEPEFQ